MWCQIRWGGVNHSSFYKAQNTRMTKLTSMGIAHWATVGNRNDPVCCLGFADISSTYIVSLSYLPDDHEWQYRDHLVGQLSRTFLHFDQGQVIEKVKTDNLSILPAKHILCLTWQRFLVKQSQYLWAITFAPKHISCTTRPSMSNNATLSKWLKHFRPLGLSWTLYTIFWCKASLEPVGRLAASTVRFVLCRCLWAVIERP